ncbi:hypothetical protein HGRIS_006057 [Hohenbuehelia grisea]|uniref:Peptidase M20 dimerisation domain-containing protein n=1 Tax=Hohenbuehelia grisea TaxID=104357 RepID=A0ABR3JZN4_9AGAR
MADSLLHLPLTRKSGKEIFQHPLEEDSYGGIVLRSRRLGGFRRLLVCILTGTLVALYALGHGGITYWNRGDYFTSFFLSPLSPVGSTSPSVVVQNDKSAICPQHPPIFPRKYEDLVRKLDRSFNTSTFQSWAYQNLQGAVRIPTETFDDFGPPGEDPRWDSRLKLHDYLSERFPLVKDNLRRTAVNHFALVYHWQGTDPSRKPILLTAHQDTVPVDPETIDEWTYPPFSGHFDGELIWGRGSADCKSLVISLLTTIETLLKNGFVPTQTVVLAFGMDEEMGGVNGGPAVRDYLLGEYGQNGFSMLVDEGLQFEGRGDLIFAQPSVSEKGVVSIKLDVSAPGGHAGTPPRHTSIAYLSLLLGALDSQPFPPHLFRNGSYFKSLECDAQHDPSLPGHVRDLIFKARHSDAALLALQEDLLESDELFGTIVSTTQAMTVIGGGVKTNALPTSAWANIDHRIADWSSTADVRQHYVDIITPLAKKYGLSFEAFDNVIIPSGLASTQGHIRIVEMFGVRREPSPVTPTEGSGPWELLSGTILSTLKTSMEDDNRNKTIIIQPTFVGIGNTDTGHYWNLTKNIFRYAHFQEGHSQGEHGIGEAIRAKSYLEIIRFFVRLIINAEESELLGDSS